LQSRPHAYSPLARGFLSGAVKSRERYAASDFRQRIPWWNPENFEQNLAIVGDLTTLAESKGVTLSQLALAWLLAKKDYIVPIPGSRDPGRVARNVAAADLKLTADDLARIDEIAPEGGIGGRGF
jgi:aryl-alcohol dehydrogenase-like predicted oxidoreductase